MPRSPLIIPRLSEKSVRMNGLNQYVFKVEGKATKIMIRHAVEQSYGVKVARVNMVSVRGKVRRYGKTSGKTGNFKKAIVTLTPDSKKIDIIESA